MGGKNRHRGSLATGHSEQDEDLWPRKNQLSELALDCLDTGTDDLELRSAELRFVRFCESRQHRDPLVDLWDPHEGPVTLSPLEISLSSERQERLAHRGQADTELVGDPSFRWQAGTGQQALSFDFAADELRDLHVQRAQTPPRTPCQPRTANHPETGSQQRNLPIVLQSIL